MVMEGRRGEGGWQGRVPDVDTCQAGEKSQAGGDTRGAARADAVPAVCVCVCARARACVGVCVWVRGWVWVCVGVWVCACVCMCVWGNARARARARVCLRINLHATRSPPSEAAEARFGYHWQWRTAACLSVPVSTILGSSHSGRLRREHLAGNGNHARWKLAWNDQELCTRNADVLVCPHSRACRDIRTCLHAVRSGIRSLRMRLPVGREGGE